MEIQKTLADDTGVVSGYNITKFDLKTINSSLQNMARNDKENVAKYIEQKYGITDISKIGIVQNKEDMLNVLDLQDFARAYTGAYGPSSLIGEDIYNRIYGKRPNRQEYLGERWYPQFMQSTSHTAAADIEVANAFILENASGMNKSLLNFMHEGIHNSGKYTSSDLKSYGTGIPLFIANKNARFNNDRESLNFVSDSAGNIHFSSGHYITSPDGILEHSKINKSPSIGIKKDQAYFVRSINTFDAGSFSNEISAKLPNYSSGRFHVLKLEQYVPEQYKDYSAEKYIYHVFDTEEELYGFLNSTFSHLGTYEEKNKTFTFSSDAMEERVKPMWSKKNKRKSYYGLNKTYGPEKKKWSELSSLDKLDEFLNSKMKKTINQKTANFTSGDKSIKRIAGALDFLNRIERDKNKTFGMDIFDDTIALLKYYNSAGVNELVTKSGKVYGTKEFKKLQNIMKVTLGYRNGNTFEVLPTTALNAISSMQDILKMRQYYTNVLDSLLGVSNPFSYKYSIKNLKANDKIFNEVNNLLMSNTATGYYKSSDKAIKAASKVMPSFDSEYNLKHTYDFKLSDDFYRRTPLQRIKKFNIFSETNDDLFTVNTGSSDPLTILLDNLLNRHMGKIVPQNEVQRNKYTKAAFSKFVGEINTNRSSHKELFGQTDFTDMVDRVLEGNIDLFSDATILLDAIKNAKEQNINAGILKPKYSRTARVSNGFAVQMNNLSKSDIKAAIDKLNINTLPISDGSERSISNSNSAIQSYINTISSHYMFDADELKNMNFRTEFDKKRAYRLYEDFRTRIDNTLHDLFEAADLSGTDITFNNKTGQIFLQKGEEVVPILNIPKLMRDGDVLYLKTSSGTSLQFFEKLELNKHNKLKLTTNLGDKFGTSKDRITKTVANSINNGTFSLDLFAQSMSIHSRDYKEAAHLNFSMKDMVTSNGMIDISGLDPIFSTMFGKDSTKEGRALWNKLVSEGKIHNPRIADHLNKISGKLGAGDLSPDYFALLISDLPAILEPFLDTTSTNYFTMKDVIDHINTTGKDTNVADKLLQTNIRNLGNTFNSFDNIGRPTIISELNAKFFRSNSLIPDHILNSNTIDGTKYFYENLLIRGSIIETKDVMRNIYKNLNIGLPNNIELQTDFTQNASYLGVLGLENTIRSEASRVIENFKFDNNLNIDVNKHAELVEKTYGQISNIIGKTYEQSRIMDSRLVDELYGNIPQDIQTISGIKEILGAIDTMNRDIAKFGKIPTDFYLDFPRASPIVNREERIAPNRVKDLLRITGTIREKSDGTYIYEKSAGTIVHRGETILKTSTYGGGTESIGSKFNTGILNFTMRTKEGIELEEEEISKLVTRKLNQMSREEASKIINNQEEVLKLLLNVIDDNSDYGIKGAFEIINANLSELVKTGTAEKGMTNLIRTKAGSLDDTLQYVLELVGAKHHIDKDALSPQAFAAYIEDFLDYTQDYGKRHIEALAFHELGIDTNNRDFDSIRKEAVDKIMSLRYIEQNEASRMIFGKEGIFKGETSIILNDNVLGHGNYGLATSGMLSKAAELYGKALGANNNLSAEEQYALGLENIVKLINSNDDYNFIRTHKTIHNPSGKGKAITDVSRNFSFDKDKKTIIFGDELRSSIDEFDTLDMEKFNNLILAVDKELEKRGVSQSDRLVHENVYVLGKNGE